MFNFSVGGHRILKLAVDDLSVAVLTQVDGSPSISEDGFSLFRMVHIWNIRKGRMEITKQIFNDFDFQGAGFSQEDLVLDAVHVYFCYGIHIVVYSRSSLEEIARIDTGLAGLKMARPVGIGRILLASSRTMKLFDFNREDLHLQYKAVVWQDEGQPMCREVDVTDSTWPSIASIMLDAEPYYPSTIKTICYQKHGVRYAG